MGAAALPIIAGIGTVGGLLQGRQANKNAQRQLGLQQSQAQQQANLFGQTSPYYSQLLQAFSGLAGLPSQGGGAAPGAQQLPYTNVTPGQLGIFGNPTDALRLRAAEDYSRQATQQSLHNTGFGLGQRGLLNSSIAGAQQAAIEGDAARQRSDFARQLAIQAPQEAMNRLSSLAGLLNPGLGAGPAAANIFGQGAQAYGQMGQAAGQQAGSSLSNYLQYQNLNALLKKYQQPSGGWQDTSNVSYLPPPGAQAAATANF